MKEKSGREGGWTGAEAMRPAAVPDSAAVPPGDRPAVESVVRSILGRRAVVLVGLMGAGKSTVGRRLAARLGLPFRDADHEIEVAADMPIGDIFAVFGEPYFRAGERRVIARLLQEGPLVLATGGGAFMDASTRARIRETGVSVWLRAELPVLMRRVRKRSNRPLLKTADPEATMRGLMELRHPVYAEADLVIESRDVSHERVVDEVLDALTTWLSAERVGRLTTDGAAVLAAQVER